MKQFDVPFTALSAIGEHAMAALHTILVRDLLISQNYRTNRELGLLLGLGEKRVVQLLDNLERYGLVFVQPHGRKRIINVSLVPNDVYVDETYTLLTGSEVPVLSDEARASEEAEEAFGERAGQVTSHLLRVWTDLLTPNWPKSESGVTAGYVRPWDGGTDLAFYYTHTGTTYYTYSVMKKKKEIVHATLSDSLGLAALAVKRKKASVTTKNYAQIPSTSFGFRFWPRERLEQDTEYYAQVVRVLDTWNTTMGSAISLIGETYRLIRQNLAENGISADDLVLAVENFSRDPWWRDKRPGLAAFFDKPARVLEFVNKTAGHDRFGRNLQTTPVVDENGEKRDAWKF